MDLNVNEKKSQLINYAECTFFASERTIKSDKIFYYCVENTETVITNSGNEVN